MWTGEVTHVSGYVVIDEATRSIALSSGITQLHSDCTCCAKVPTRVREHLVSCVRVVSVYTVGCGATYAEIVDVQ